MFLSTKLVDIIRQSTRLVDGCRVFQGRGFNPIFYPRFFSSAADIKKKRWKSENAYSAPVILYTNETAKQLSTQEVKSILQSNQKYRSDIIPLTFSFIDRDDIDSETIELGVRSLYKTRRYSSVNTFVRGLLDQQSPVPFTPYTIEMIFESLISEKDYQLIDPVWNHLSVYVKRSWRISSLYLRALLGANRLDDCRSIMASLEKRGFSVPYANASILLGLYEGKYYEKCVSFYKKMTEYPSTRNIIDPRGYFAVILSFYQLNDYVSVISLYNFIETKHFWPSREVVYAVSEILSKGDFWKEEYERKMMGLSVKGEFINRRKQTALLAQCRRPQLVRGGEIVGSFLKHNKETLIANDRKKNLYMKLSTYEETQRKLRLVDAFVEINTQLDPSQYQKDLLIVRTIRNDKPLMKLLNTELYPSILFYRNKDFLSIPISSITTWYKYSKDEGLSF